MKYLINCFFAVFACFGLAVSTCLADLPKTQTIRGTVVDVTPDYSDAALSKLEGMTMEQESKEHFINRLHGNASPVRGAAVTVKCGSIKRKAITDSKGEFEFRDLPIGKYKFSVRGPSVLFGKAIPLVLISDPIVSNPHLLLKPGTVPLKVRTDAITIKGRILDYQGRPVVGAKVRGEPYPLPPLPEAGPTPYVAKRFGVSGADGEYELIGFVPGDFFREGLGYLVNGEWGVTGENDKPFYVKIFVEANGFAQDDVPTVPLVTDRLLNQARRWMRVLSRWSEHEKKPFRVEEKANIYVPANKDNTITGIDIFLSPRIDTGEYVPKNP